MGKAWGNLGERTDQDRPGQTREDFNLADLILELAFLLDSQAFQESPPGPDQSVKSLLDFHCEVSEVLHASLIKPSIVS